MPQIEVYRFLSISPFGVITFFDRLGKKPMVKFSCVYSNQKENRNCSFIRWNSENKEYSKTNIRGHMSYFDFFIVFEPLRFKKRTVRPLTEPFPPLYSQYVTWKIMHYIFWKTNDVINNLFIPCKLHTFIVRPKLPLFKHLIYSLSTYLTQWLSSTV